MSKYEQGTATHKCPDCHGPMRNKHGRRGEFLACLRWPDCRGTRELTSPAPETHGEKEPKAVVISPILYLTGDAICGLCARGDLDKDDIIKTAVAIARGTLAELRRTAKPSVQSAPGTGAGETAGPARVPGNPQPSGTGVVQVGDKR